MQGLIKRFFTALFFVVVMITGLYGGRYSFVALFAVITGVCLWEFFDMVLLKDKRRDMIRRVIALGVGLMPFILASILQLNLINDKQQFIAVSAFLFSPFVFLAFIYELYSNSETPFVNIAFIMLGMIYIGVPFALLDFIAFEGEYFYANTIFGLLLMSWANDTAAYLFGSRFGKNLLFPRISPKKTWEGTLGGVVVTFLIALLLFYLIDDLRLVDWLALACIIAVFGSIGDLVESMLKRSMQVKDSGRMLPGHGGLLDRFDGFIFMLPFATAYLLLVR